MIKTKSVNQYENALYEARIWRIVSYSLLVFVVISSVLLVVFAYLAYGGIRNERVILVPGLQNKVVVPASSYISKNFVKGIVSKVVSLQEQWTYESIQDQFDELSKFYYTDGLGNLTNANLISTDRFNYVREKKMISTFKIDYEKSEFDFCEKIQSLCAFVVGTRKLYINHNEILSEKKVFYFLLGDGVYPTEDHPFAVKISRIKIGEEGEDGAEENVRTLFLMSKEGKKIGESVQ